jgi:hypothetical protein
MLDLVGPVRTSRHDLAKSRQARLDKSGRPVSTNGRAPGHAGLPNSLTSLTKLVICCVGATPLYELLAWEEQTTTMIVEIAMR